MTAPELRAEDVHVHLGRRAALVGIDAVIAPGAFTIVVGPNGAGKTTLLRALAGVVPLSRGTVTIGSSPLKALSARERARTIAFLPQGGSIAWPIPVASVVALGRMPHGEENERLPEAGRRAVAAAIAAVGLEQFEDRRASELSGGERARVLLARALATEAAILLADEPVAALDPHHQLRVIEVLRRRARDGGVVVAVMHDLALAARFADRVLVMREGRLIADGAPRDVLTPDRLAASFGIEASVTERDDALLLTPWRALS
jgi:iron complex transport system ATP-binding protein